jgi:hypothetical protein
MDVAVKILSNFTVTSEQKLAFDREMAILKYALPTILIFIYPIISCPLDIPPTPLDMSIVAASMDFRVSLFIHPSV